MLGEEKDGGERRVCSTQYLKEGELTILKNR
jgi:hypothetical protein